MLIWGRHGEQRLLYSSQSPKERSSNEGLSPAFSTLLPLWEESRGKLGKRQGVAALTLGRKVSVTVPCLFPKLGTAQHGEQIRNFLPCCSFPLLDWSIGPNSPVVKRMCRLLLKYFLQFKNHLLCAKKTVLAIFGHILKSKLRPFILEHNLKYTNNENYFPFSPALSFLIW